MSPEFSEVGRTQKMLCFLEKVWKSEIANGKDAIWSSSVEAVTFDHFQKQAGVKSKYKSTS